MNKKLTGDNKHIDRVGKLDSDNERT